MLILESSFKKKHKGKEISLYTMKNKNGLVVQITNYGAIIVSLYVPDRNGELADIVQGYDNIEDYMEGNGPYMGAVCGRCANRIAGGKFTLNEKEYILAVNNGPNHLHGGIRGFDKVVWNVIEFSADLIILEYLSKDGEEGYPGNLKVSVKYTITDQDEFRIDYSAVTDKITIVNLTSHSYFNLSEEGSGDILNQQLMINANYYTPIDQTSVPTGEILKVKETPMDFTFMRPIGAYIDTDSEQLRLGSGYDHNWVLDKPYGKMGLAALAHDPVSGRVMEITTTQPGLQLYTANWVDGEKGKGGKKYQKRWAFCLETQCFADAVNKPHFPQVVLKPGLKYYQSTVHRFFII
ncbi:MAG: galactose mutarotase [Bacteroidales bacterium]|nr:galactose mutarotase [Bacteroidales bacterium]